MCNVHSLCYLLNSTFNPNTACVEKVWLANMFEKKERDSAELHGGIVITEYDWVGFYVLEII